MGEFSSIINSLIANKRTKQSIKNIERNNELRRNITHYKPSDIEGFIERDQELGPYIISGDSEGYRARATSSIAACSLSINTPVLVMHEGSTTLEAAITAATSFSNNKVIIGKGSAIYDPFYNRSEIEICNLIMNSVGQLNGISAVGQQFILGLAEFIRSKNIPLYYDMFARCPFNFLLDKVDDAEKQGYLSDIQALQIRNQLMQGQAERANIQAFFGQLAFQGNGILSTKSARSSAVNIKTAVDHSGMIVIDVGSSTNELLINLLVNEIKETISTGKNLTLIIDGINVSSNALLNQLVKSMPSRCLLTLSAEDVYSMIGADDKLFHALVGNSMKCIVFSHPVGVSSNKWAEVFGYYDVDKVSRNLGTNHNFQWGYGSATSSSISVTTNREFVVKPEEISKMPLNEVYILDKPAHELAHATLR